MHKASGAGYSKWLWMRAAFIGKVGHLKPHLVQIECAGAFDTRIIFCIRKIKVMHFGFGNPDLYRQLHQQLTGKIAHAVAGRQRAVQVNGNTAAGCRKHIGHQFFFIEQGPPVLHSEG